MMNPEGNIPELDPYEDAYSLDLRRIEMLAYLLDGGTFGAMADGG